MRELICFFLPSFCVVQVLVSAFSLCSDLSPCSHGHTEICLMTFLGLSPFPVVGATREVES